MFDCIGSPDELVVAASSLDCLGIPVGSLLVWNPFFKDPSRWCVWSFRPSSPFAAAAPYVFVSFVNMLENLLRICLLKSIFLGDFDFDLAAGPHV